MNRRIKVIDALQRVFKINEQKRSPEIQNRGACIDRHFYIVSLAGLHHFWWVLDPRQIELGCVEKCQSICGSIGRDRMEKCLLNHFKQTWSRCAQDCASGKRSEALKGARCHCAEWLRRSMKHGERFRPMFQVSARSLWKSPVQSSDTSFIMVLS